MHTHTVDFGNGVVAGTGARNRILDFDGIESLPTDGALADHAILDGGKVTAVRAGMRRITYDIEFACEIGWDAVPRLFPQAATFPLRITRDSVTRRAVGIRTSPLVPLGGRGVLDPVAYQVSLVCENPYLLGEEVVLRSRPVSGLEYPIEYNPTITYEELDLDGDTETFIAVNEGDYPTGFTLDYAVLVSGDLELYIDGTPTVIGPLVAGDRVVLDTTRRTIRVNGANGFSLLQSSRFPRLPKGTSAIVASGAVGLSTISFTPLFEGV